MNALIIEDEYLVAQCIEDHLRELGYTSFSYAMDEREAIEAARRRCPDLITADVQLVDGCGIDAVHSICTSKPIPVLYITGSAPMVRERCPDAIILQKPFSFSGIRAGVKEARKAA